MTDEKIAVTLDSVAYGSKPSQYIGAITNRMKASGPCEVTREEFAAAVKAGRTWCGGCFEPSQGDWGRFECLQVVGLDFDNDAVVFREVVNGKGEKEYKAVLDAEGHKLKRQLMPHETGYLDPVDAIERCKQLGLVPLMLYFSFSAHCSDKVKFRLVIDLQERIEDEADAQAIIASLMLAFPECDPSCSNDNRLFFGSNGEVWECWRIWDGAE